MDLEKILNIKYPIIQGGMAHIATGEFAAAVSNAGALGTIASGAMSASDLNSEIKKCKIKTDNPFAVNLIMIRKDIESLIEVILDNKVNIVTIGAGSPGKFLETLKKEGVKVLPVVSSPLQISRLEKSDCSAYIAEGMEAGGHIGHMTSMVLVPQAKDITKKPIICAGGIASGKQMLAAEILGAAGVQIGTGFLFTKECPIHENYKKKLIESSSSKVTVIGKNKRIPIRLLKNNMTREYEKLERNYDFEKLENFTVGRLKNAVVNGDIDDGSLMCGLTVGQFDKVISVKDFIDKLIYEYEEAKNGN